MRSCCHTSVTSDDMVTVMVTSHMIRKDEEGSRKDDVIQHVQHILTLRQTHSCLE